MYIILAINLGQHIFCNQICSKLCLETIWVFYLIHACVQDDFIIVIYYWKPIIVPQTSRNPIKLRSITVSWYGKSHVKLCIIIHIWGEDIGSLTIFSNSSWKFGSCSRYYDQSYGLVYALSHDRSSSSLKRRLISLSN